MSVQWDFGDGTTTTDEATTSHTYADEGTFMVSATIGERTGSTEVTMPWPRAVIAREGPDDRMMPVTGNPVVVPESERASHYCYLVDEPLPGDGADAAWLTAHAFATQGQVDAQFPGATWLRFTDNPVGGGIFVFSFPMTGGVRVGTPDSTLVSGTWWWQAGETEQRSAPVTIEFVDDTEVP